MYSYLSISRILFGPTDRTILVVQFDVVWGFTGSVQQPCIIENEFFGRIGLLFLISLLLIRVMRPGVSALLISF